MLLLEMGVGTADEDVSVLELAVEIFPFLHMLNLDVHGEAFSHKLNLIAEPLDQHPGVTLNLIETIVMRVEPLVDTVKPLVDSLEPRVECLKPPVEVLNEFLVHTAPFASEG